MWLVLRCYYLKYKAAPEKLKYKNNVSMYHSNIFSNNVIDDVIQTHPAMLSLLSSRM